MAIWLYRLLHQTWLQLIITQIKPSTNHRTLRYQLHFVCLERKQNSLFAPCFRVLTMKQKVWLEGTYAYIGMAKMNIKTLKVFFKATCSLHLTWLPRNWLNQRCKAERRSGFVLKIHVDNELNEFKLINILINARNCFAGRYSSSNMPTSGPFVAIIYNY